MATLLGLKEYILMGRKIRRKAWRARDYDILGRFTADPMDIFADDWELEPLPKEKKKITMYQFVYHIDEGKNVYITSQLYESERAFIFANSCREILKTIPHEIEVEE